MIGRLKVTGVGRLSVSIEGEEIEIPVRDVSVRITRDAPGYVVLTVPLAYVDIVSDKSALGVVNNIHHTKGDEQ